MKNAKLFFLIISTLGVIVFGNAERDQSTPINDNSDWGKLKVENSENYDYTIPIVNLSNQDSIRGFYKCYPIDTLINMTPVIGVFDSARQVIKVRMRAHEEREDDLIPILWEIEK